MSKNVNEKITVEEIQENTEESFSLFEETQSYPAINRAVKHTVILSEYSQGKAKNGNLFASIKGYIVTNAGQPITITKFKDFLPSTINNIRGQLKLEADKTYTAKAILDKCISEKIQLSIWYKPYEKNDGSIDYEIIFYNPFEQLKLQVQQTEPNKVFPEA